MPEQPSDRQASEHREARRENDRCHECQREKTGPLDGANTTKEHERSILERLFGPPNSTPVHVSAVLACVSFIALFALSYLPIPDDIDRSDLLKLFMQTFAMSFGYLMGAATVGSRNKVKEL